MSKRINMHLRAATLSFQLLLGFRRLDQEIFGKMNSPISQHSIRRKAAPPKQPRRDTCLCRNPMPLNITERNHLASFREGVDGKAKKAFVKRLKQKYGKA